MDVPSGFMWKRLAPLDWQQDLDRLTQRQDRATWLHLAWLAGEPWEPIQRWCVYEMVPIQLWLEIMNGNIARGVQKEDTFEWFKLQALRGKNPRELGHYDSVLGRFVSEADCTLQEWELFHQYNCVPSLYWVIQGEYGGHKRRFSPIEQKYLSLSRLPTDPPAPGDLPYAPYDRRVFDQLAKRDRLKNCNGRIETEADYQEFRRHMVDWLTEQSRHALESQKIDLDGIPRSGDPNDDPTGKIEEAIGNYIETGRTSG